MNLEDFIEPQEGFRSHLYLDSNGIWTIGWGRNMEDVGLSSEEKAYLGVPPRDIKVTGITEEEGKYMLGHDIQRTITGCCHAFDWFESLDNIRKAVVVDMAFNMGIQGFKKFKETIIYISTGRWEEAAREMLNSSWAREVKGRAKVLSEMMRTGDVPV